MIDPAEKAMLEGEMRELRDALNTQIETNANLRRDNRLLTNLHDSTSRQAMRYRHALHHVLDILETDEHLYRLGEICTLIQGTLTEEAIKTDEDY